MSAHDQLPGSANKPDDQHAPSEHLIIRVTDFISNEVFYKVKRTTALKKLMDAFCDRQGIEPYTVRFSFDGARVKPTDTPDELEMIDGDTVEVRHEQLSNFALEVPAST